VDQFAHIVQAVPLPIIVAGGPKSTPETSTLQLVRDAVAGGASGVAIGRRVWQSEDPEGITRQIHQALFA
jgi:DhnA family fructose-bisphosphate aldolase class Ia